MVDEVNIIFLKALIMLGMAGILIAYVIYLYTTLL